MSKISVNDHIDLYNNLTDINFERNDLNFLKSIKYKMKNGNILLNFLLKVKQMDIPFKVVKGFIFDEESFSEFERCLINIDSSYIDKLNDIRDDSIIITAILEDTYELSINKGES